MEVEHSSASIAAVLEMDAMHLASSSHPSHLNSASNETLEKARRRRARAPFSRLFSDFARLLEHFQLRLEQINSPDQRRLRNGNE